MSMMDVIDEGYFCKALLEDVLGLQRGKLKVAVATGSLNLENGTV